VCEPCNTGWMSRLEGKSKPILTPPITRSGPFQLDAASQEIAATWAIKTVLVFQGTQATQPLAPPHHFAQVREHERPPPSVSVRIGSHYRARFDPVNSVYTQKPLTLEPLDDKFVKASRFGYASFLAIGGLSFLVIGHRYRNRVVINCGEPFGDAVTKIWPVSALAVGWPPPLMMDRELLDAFFMRNEPPTLDVQVFGP
jgi:hypothetical protein